MAAQCELPHYISQCDEASFKKIKYQQMFVQLWWYVVRQIANGCLDSVDYIGFSGWNFQLSLRLPVPATWQFGRRNDIPFCHLCEDLVPYHSHTRTHACTHATHTHTHACFCEPPLRVGLCIGMSVPGASIYGHNLSSPTSWLEVRLSFVMSVPLSLLHLY